MADDFPPCLPGDLASLSVASGNFQSIADGSGQALSQLTGSTRYLVWSGLAADQFCVVLADMPQVLTKIQSSFGMAASALKSYVATLDGLTGDYSSYIYRYNDLLDQLAETMSRANNATEAGQDASSFLRQGQSLEEDLQALAGQLQGCIEAAMQAAMQLGLRLQDASQAGIQDDFWNTMGRYGGDVGSFLGHMVTGIIDAVKDLVEKLVNLTELWYKMEADLLTGSWGALKDDANQALKDINDIARDLTNVLGVLAPVLNLIPGVGAVLDVVLLVAAITAVATDSVELAVGDEKSWTDVAFDSLNVVLNVGGLGESRAVEDLSPTTSLEDSVHDLFKGDEAGADAHIADAQTLMNSPAYKDFVSLPETQTINSLSDLRNTAQIVRSNVTTSLAESRDLSIINPDIVSLHGLNVSYNEWKVAETAIKGVQLGHDASGLAQDPGSDYGAVASDVVGTL